MADSTKFIEHNRFAIGLRRLGRKREREVRPLKYCIYERKICFVGELHRSRISPRKRLPNNLMIFHKLLYPTGCIDSIDFALWSNWQINSKIFKLRETWFRKGATKPAMRKKRKKWKEIRLQYTKIPCSWHNENTREYSWKGS